MTDVQTVSGMNLDAIEERNEPPYTFVLGGQVLAFTDPASLDWQLLEQLDNVDVLAEHCMSEEDRKVFYKTPLPAFKLGILFEDVLRHFKLDRDRGTRRRT